MCDVRLWLFDGIFNVNWIELISALANAATAIIAFGALKSWRHQEKAKKEAEFLDALIEAVHTFIADMPTPVTLFEMEKIGIESHKPAGENAGNTVKGAIIYIHKYGKEGSKRLADALQAVQPSLVQLRSLAAKGQIFEFNDYARCQNAVAMLTYQFDRIEACVPVLGNPSLNWDHPEVLKLLNAILAIDAKDIRKSIEENNVAVLKFASDTYKRIYG